MLSPTDLKYFIEVAKTQHISRAAERLGLTQPALSHCLQRMERSVGQPLFIRTKKGVVLTSSGQRLLEQVEQLSSQWDRLLVALKEDAETVSGLIRLGCHTAVAQYTFPNLFPTLLKDHPALEIRLQHGLSRHMTEMVVSDSLDAAIAVNPVAHPELVIKELCRDDVTLWRSRHCLNPDVLLIEPNLIQTETLRAKIARHGLHFKRVIESSSLEVLSQMAAAGTGCAILPERVIKAISDERIERVKDAPVFEDRICLVYKKEFTRIQRGKAFVSHALKTLKR